jgi:hypothetical protein
MPNFYPFHQLDLVLTQPSAPKHQRRNEAGLDNELFKHFSTVCLPNLIQIPLMHFTAQFLVET